MAPESSEQVRPRNLTGRSSQWARPSLPDREKSSTCLVRSHLLERHWKEVVVGAVLGGTLACTQPSAVGLPRRHDASVVPLPTTLRRADEPGNLQVDRRKTRRAEVVEGSNFRTVSHQWFRARDRVESPVISSAKVTSPIPTRRRNTGWRRRPVALTQQVTSRRRLDPGPAEEPPERRARTAPECGRNCWPTALRSTW